MAVAVAEAVGFSYHGAPRAALSDVSLTIEPGEVVLLLGRSGSGKTTLLRALAGLVPHFHGGRFAGRVAIGGRDTRRTRPAELAGTMAILFQDPEDQVVFGAVEAEIAFGIENAGTPPEQIARRVRAALAAVEAGHLLERKVAGLSGGELQRICLASTLALEPSVLLLDEPTAQLDEAAATALLALLRRIAGERGAAVVLSEQRPARALAVCDRVVVLEQGSVLFDGSRDQARGWLAAARPEWLGLRPIPKHDVPAETMCRLDAVSFAYPDGPPVLEGAGLELRRNEIVGLTGPNGSGKSTLAKLAAGLLAPGRGSVRRSGRVSYLSQDPGRYLARERCDDEVALGAHGDGAAVTRTLAAVGLAGHEARHPRDLSSGERERLALAAVLATEPGVLILDEPTRGVDPEARQALAALLRAQAARRATLLVTHDLELLDAVADRTVALGQAGEVLAA